MEALLERLITFFEERGCSYVEGRFESTESNSLVLKNGSVDALGVDTHKGIGIRFQYHSRVGFFSTNTKDEATALRQAKRAFRETKTTPSITQQTALAEEKKKSKHYRVFEREKLANVPIEDKIAYLKSISDTIHDSHTDVKTNFLAYEDTKTKQLLKTSEGITIKSTIPQESLFYMTSLQNGTRSMQRNWEYGATGGYEQVKQWNLHTKLHDEIQTLGQNLRHAKRIRPKKMDVLCAPEVVGIMVHESAGHPYEADRILGREAAQAGESFVSQSMIGSRIGSDDVTVVDDPRLKNNYCHFKYDNEGVKARENTLIKNGIINGFLHNRETSAAMGRSKSNGCSRASDYAKESMVRMSNTYLKKGTHTEDELIEGVREGIHLKNYMEWNIDDRRLNQKYVGAESYYIKNGKIQYPVYNPILEVTTPKLWSSVDGLGKKISFHAGQCGKGEPMQGIPVTFGGPSMRLRNMRIQ